MYPSPTPGLYASAHSRARITRMLLIGLAVMSGLSLVISPLELLFFPLSDDEVAAEGIGTLLFALVLLGLGLLQIMLYVSTVVVFLMWLYRSYENLPAFGTPVRSLEYSSGWAVGSFFDPFVNLVVPYRAVRELWQKSEPFETSLGSQSPPAILPLWWGFWIVSNIASNISLRVAFSDDIARENVVTIGLIADALNIISAIFAVIVVGEIVGRQEAAGKALAFSQAGPPLPPTSFDELPQAQPFPTA